MRVKESKKGKHSLNGDDEREVEEEEKEKEKEEQKKVEPDENRSAIVVSVTIHSSAVTPSHVAGPKP